MFGHSDVDLTHDYKSHFYLLLWSELWSPRFIIEALTFNLTVFADGAWRG
jgi:hypothetical protein